MLFRSLLYLGSAQQDLANKPQENIRKPIIAILTLISACEILEGNSGDLPGRGADGSCLFVVPVKNCGLPVSLDVEHGTYLNYHRTLYNDLIKFECDYGWMFEGEEATRCQEDGTWSPLPRCVGTLSTAH